MGKIILIRHGQASFGQQDYDQLSETGKYQAKVTGCYFKQAKIHPTTLYSGTLKRQQETAEIIKLHAGFKPKIKVDPIYNEYFYQAIIDSQLPGLIESDPTVTEDVDNAFTDLQAFRRVFSKLLKRWVSGKYDSKGVETFEAYTQRMINGINSIAREQDQNDIAIVFTSGGFIAMSMHLILGLHDVEALKLGWQIYNCSLTSFFCNNSSFQLDTFNSVGHLEMDASPGILSYI
ncbi:Phosphoglycerate mutase domain protein [Candidatus Magnetomorum sp. HK-1]|nr:Phosphoglycerate mutase domain protein [Candidatus Magnetomorum sp. HK-1]